MAHVFSLGVGLPGDETGVLPAALAAAAATGCAALGTIHAANRIRRGRSQTLARAAAEQRPGRNRLQDRIAARDDGRGSAQQYGQRQPDRPGSANSVVGGLRDETFNALWSGFMVDLLAEQRED